jgi:hypothetical protein
VNVDVNPTSCRAEPWRKSWTKVPFPPFFIQASAWEEERKYLY